MELSMKRLLRLASAVLGFAFVLATPLAASASTQERFSVAGQGDLLHDVSNFHFSKGPFSLNSHLNGNARVASATATVNGNDVGASLFAEMHNVKSGDIVICHMC